MNLKQRYSRSVAAIPRFNFWEAAVMAFVLFTGIRGFIGISSIAPLALGPLAPIWWIICIIAPLIYMSGQFMEVPNGLFVSMIGAVLISVASFALYGGLAVVMGSIFFTGFTTLLIFGVGCAISTVQMLMQMLKLKTRLGQMLSKEE